MADASLTVSSVLPPRVAFVALRPPRAATGETATIAYHHHVLEQRMGVEVVHLARDAVDGFSLSLLSSAKLGHLSTVRPRLGSEPQLPVVWFVPSPGQVPIVAWAMRGLPNPAAVVVEGASLLREGDWRNALRRMPRFFVTRAALNGENLARLVRLARPARPLVVATASQYHLRRLQRVLPAQPCVWLPNGSPDLPLRSIWQPPATPNPRVIGHALFNKGADLAFAAAAQVARNRPDLTIDWARPDSGLVPHGFFAPGLSVRTHNLVDPYAFLAAASLVLVPLRLSCGTNVYPNVLIEAMSAGVPLLTSNLPAHRELLGPEATDALVPDFQPSTWAARLDALLNDPPRMQALAAQLLDRARALWGGDAPVQQWTQLLAAMGAVTAAAG
ncbi:MAG: glycosyltransferase [Chloroflexota bacterium]